MEINQTAILQPGLKNKHMEPNLLKRLLLPAFSGLLVVNPGK